MRRFINASFDVRLPAGTYYSSIDGVGRGSPMADPPIGYSDYGILGYYSVIALPEPGQAWMLAFGVGFLAVVGRSRIAARRC